MQYEAISYTWGPPIFPETLRLGDVEMKITTSLFGALRRFRDCQEIVTLWADAICINQSDRQEREQQVSIMADVYSSAEHVLVWLGDAQPSDAMAFCMAEAMTARRAHLLGVPELQLSELDPLLPSLSKRASCDCCQEPISWGDDPVAHGIAAIVQLLQRPWFSRLWVVQEIRVSGSARLFCGSHSITQDTLGDAICQVDVETEWDDLGGDADQWTRLSDQAMVTLQIGEPGLDSLVGTLCDSAMHGASEPGDRVFALRAVCMILDDERFLPDYEVPLSELWKRVVVHHVTTESRRLAQPDMNIACPSLVLALGGAENQSNEADRLSWVADFARLSVKSRAKNQFYIRNCTNYDGQAPKNHAGGLRPFHAHYDAGSPELLQTRGRVLSSITKIIEGSRFPEPSGLLWKSHLLEAILPWCVSCWKLMSDLHGSRVPFLELRALVSHSANTVNYTDDEELRDCATELTDLLKGILGDGIHDTEIESFTSYTVHSFLAADRKDIAADLALALAPLVIDQFEFLDTQRLLALSSDDTIAWVPDTAQIGDEICIFEGACFPFVIRDRVDESYRLIGDAYVHGVMHGEAWPECADDLQTIMLR
ncbi:hypothetical protein LTR85_001432 [Meristemomyces frigidus]|nr:hypothetical protein LTR85_001432 [Meristemomyces frigidus]